MQVFGGLRQSGTKWTIYTADAMQLRRELYIILVVLPLVLASTYADTTNECLEELLDVVVPPGDQPREDRLARHQQYKDEIDERKDELELVLYGDSIIRHARRLGGDFFDSVYNEWYDGTMAYGISGNTASEMLWCLRDGEFPRGLHPRAVVLLAGTNDVMHVHHPGVDEIESDDDSSQTLTTIEVLDSNSLRKVADDVSDALEYAGILIHQRSCSTKVVILGLLPASFGQDHQWPNRYTPAIVAVNTKLERMVSHYSHLTYADCSSAFLNEDGEAVREDMMPDGVHPNENGQVALALCLRAHLDLALGENTASDDNEAGESEEETQDAGAEEPTEDVEEERTEERSGSVVGDLQDGGNGEAAEQTEDAGEGFRVEIGPWSSCPVPCGGGVQTRGSRCLRVASGEVVGMPLCPGPKPASWELSRPCNTNVCGGTEERGVVEMSREARWVPGPWQPCELPQGCGDIDFVRDLICIGADGRAVPSSPESACGNVFKPQSSSVRSRAVDLCADTLTGSPRSGGTICNGRGTCVRPLGNTAGHHRNASSSCICNDGWSGPTCLVPPACDSGVLASDGACCDTGVISSVGECCAGSPALTDANGRCCSSGSQLDACGRCAPSSSAVDRASAATSASRSSASTPAVVTNALSHFELTTRADITGVCCEEAAMSASGFCCLRDNVDECGVCGGNGGSCALRASLRLNLPNDYRYPEDMEEMGFGEVFSWLASSVLVHVGGLAVSPDDVKVQRYARVPEQPRRRRALLQPLDVLSHDGGSEPAEQPLMAHEDIMGGFGAGMAASMRSLPVSGNDAAENNNLWEVEIEVQPARGARGHPLTSTFFKQVWEQAVTDGGNLGGFELHPSPLVTRKGICGNAACETGEMGRTSPDYCPADCPDVAYDSCPVPSVSQSSPTAGGLTSPVGSSDQQCNGRGLCVALSRACSCFHGYAGNDCTECAAGFVAIVDSQGAGSCVAQAALLLGGQGARNQPTASDSSAEPLDPETVSNNDGGTELVEVSKTAGDEKGLLDFAWLDQFQPWIPYAVVGFASFILLACTAGCALLYCRCTRRAAEQSALPNPLAFDARAEPDKRSTDMNSTVTKGVRLEDLCDDPDTIAAKQKHRAVDAANGVRNFSNPVFSSVTDNSEVRTNTEAAPMVFSDAPPPPAVMMLQNPMADSVVDASTFLEDSTIIDIDDLSNMAAYHTHPDGFSPTAEDSSVPDYSFSSSRPAAQHALPAPDMSLDISMLSIGEEEIGSHYVEGPAMDLSLDMSMVASNAAAPVSDEGEETCVSGSLAPRTLCSGDPFQCNIEGIERTPVTSNLCNSVSSELERMPELERASVEPGVPVVSRCSSYSEFEEEGLEGLVHHEGDVGNECKREAVYCADSRELTPEVDESILLTLQDDESEEAPGDDVPTLAESGNPFDVSNAPLMQWDEGSSAMPDVPSLASPPSTESQQRSTGVVTAVMSTEPTISHHCDSMDPFSALFGDLQMGTAFTQASSGTEAPKVPTHTPTPSGATDVMDLSFLSMDSGASGLQRSADEGAMTSQKECSSMNPSDIMSEWMSSCDARVPFDPLAKLSTVQQPKTSVQEDGTSFSPGNPFADPLSPSANASVVHCTAGAEASSGSGDAQQAVPSQSAKSDNPFAYGSFLDLLG